MANAMAIASLITAVTILKLLIRSEVKGEQSGYGKKVTRNMKKTKINRSEERVAEMWPMAESDKCPIVRTNFTSKIIRE